MVPSDHSYPYLARTDCNHVHGGEVSQSMDAEYKSLMPDLCHLQPLTSEEEGPESRPTQVGSLIDPFFSNPIFSGNIFTHASGDFPTYLVVDATEPLEFDDPLFECLGTHQEVEALQLSLMVMSGSHVLDETPEPSRIRVSAHHAPHNSF